LALGAVGYGGLARRDGVHASGVDGRRGKLLFCRRAGRRDSGG
jgi:hypothetical protein